MIAFDAGDPAELEMRSALCYATSFKCPVRLWHGSEETRSAAAARLTVERARAARLDVETAEVPGGHTSALPEETRRAMAFFASRGGPG